MVVQVIHCPRRRREVEVQSAPRVLSQAPQRKGLIFLIPTETADGPAAVVHCLFITSVSSFKDMFIDFRERRREGGRETEKR